MKQKINYKEYRKYFTTKGNISCLQTEFLLKGSLSRAGILVTNSNNQFHTFLNLKKEKECLDEGVELYSDNIKFNKYLFEFRKYIIHAYLFIIPKYSVVPKKIEKEEFIELIKFLGRLWYFYGFGEYLHQDKIYKIAQLKGKKEILNNLEIISNFKFKAREVMNRYFFRGGIIENILKSISKNFLKNNDAFYLYSDEIISLFDNTIPDEKLISERKKCYTAIANPRPFKFNFEDALEINKNLTSFENTKEINGVGVNPGKIKGKVIICPMLKSHDEILIMNKKMNKGDILITESTSPDVLILCNKASAIIAEQGGYLSHAAIISRELNIPCIVWAINATRVFRNGDYVEVDADKGYVNLIFR